MENTNYYWSSKSSFLLYYRICICDRQSSSHFNLHCYRVCMLLGCFDCAAPYSSTSALTLILSHRLYKLLKEKARFPSCLLFMICQIRSLIL
jgi:hypothetical protein